MDTGLIISAIFFFIVAIAVLVGLSKGKKYVWQYTLTRLIVNVTAVIIAIPLTSFISDILADKLFARAGESGILKSLTSAKDVAIALTSMIMGLFLFFFVRLIVKFVLKFLAPTISSLLISLSDLVSNNRERKKEAAKEAARMEKELEMTALQEIIDSEADGEAKGESDGEAAEKSSALPPLKEEKSVPKEKNATESSSNAKSEAKRNGCYALRPQLLSILIGIVGCVFGVVVVFAPFTGLIGLAHKAVTSVDASLLEKAEVDEELYGTVTGVTGGAAVKFTNAFGGNLIFNSLTSRKINSTKIGLKDEVNLVSVIAENASSLTNESTEKQTRIDAIEDILDAFDGSAVIPLVLSDLISGAADALERGEEVMGIMPPVSEGNEIVQDTSDKLLSELILSFKGCTPNSVKTDIRTLGDIVTVLINRDALATLTDNPEGLISDKTLIKELLAVFFSNDRLSSLTSTFIELGIDMLEDKLGMADSLDTAYAQLKSALSALDSSLSDAERVAKVREVLNEYGIDVTSAGAAALAEALKTSGVTEALRSVEINKSGKNEAVDISTAELFEKESLLITKSEVIITHKDSISNPEREAELIAEALSSVETLADAFADSKDDISSLLRAAGSLLDNLSATEIVGKGTVDTLLLVMFQSEKAKDALPMNIVEITNFVNSLIRGTENGKGYESVMTEIADMADALSKIQDSDEENPTDSVTEALKNISPEAAEALMHVATPDFVEKLGVEKESSETVADVLASLFGEISTAKDEDGLGLSDAEYEAETEKISNLLDVTLGMSSGEETEELEVGNYVDSIMESKILTNTVINSVYDEDGNVKIDPLGSEKELTADEEAELVRSLNEKLDTAKNASYESEAERLAAIEDTEKLAVAVAAYMNTEVEIVGGSIALKP